MLCPLNHSCSPSEVEHRVALQWRFSIPIMMLVVTLMAIPLSRIDPRSGRFGRILPAVLLYFAYLVSLNALRGAIRGWQPAIKCQFVTCSSWFLLAWHWCFCFQSNYWCRSEGCLSLSQGSLSHE